MTAVTSEALRFRNEATLLKSKICTASDDDFAMSDQDVSHRSQKVRNLASIFDFEAL